LQAQLIDDQFEQDATSDRRKVISDGLMQRSVASGYTHDSFNVLGVCARGVYAVQQVLCSAPEPVDESTGSNGTICDATRDAMFIANPSSTAMTLLIDDDNPHFCAQDLLTAKCSRCVLCTKIIRLFDDAHIRFA
jgi:hypothetical protein